MSFSNKLIADSYRARAYTYSYAGVPIFERNYGNPLELKFGEREFAGALGNAKDIKGIMVRSVTVTYLQQTFIEGGFNSYDWIVYAGNQNTGVHQIVIPAGRYTITELLDLLVDNVNYYSVPIGGTVSYSIDSSGIVTLTVSTNENVTSDPGSALGNALIFDVYNSSAPAVPVTETSPTLLGMLGFDEFTIHMYLYLPPTFDTTVVHTVSDTGFAPFSIEVPHRLFVTCPSHCPGYRGKINVYDGSGIGGWGTIKHLEGAIAEFPLANHVRYGDVINVDFPEPIPFQFSKKYEPEDVISLYIKSDLYSTFGLDGVRWTVELTFF